MYQYKLYNSREIDKLKEDLEVYKQTLVTMESSNLLDKYLQLQRELYEIKLKFSKFKGEMKTMEESYQEKIAEYERQDQRNSIQTQTINDSLNQLKQDVTSIKGEMKEIRVTELLEKMKLVSNRMDNSLAIGKSQIDTQKKELLQSKEHIKTNPPIKTVPKTSEYKRLQNMLYSLTNENQAPSQFNSRTTPNKMARKLPTSNQTSTRSRQFGGVRNTLSTSNGKNTLQRFPYELNKNIITRTSKPKPTEKTYVIADKEESTSSIKNDNHSQAENGKTKIPVVTDNTQKMNADHNSGHVAKAREEMEDSHKNLSSIENQYNNEVDINQEAGFSVAEDNTLDTVNESSGEMVSANRSEMSEAKTRLNRAGRKRELNSFFSFFRKN
ncbi:hypothetical protein QGM71_12135 [Virgibacillus sp. C22-A2]|uniref:Uncharacterized protein n=1 Tax=Virgibacillus tibetensis TaxID=3042313 RepID=A0ABU6KGD0_9BACI|nr:hypothetical protein [Virgibacillus sp. C22-A2]